MLRIIKTLLFKLKYKYARTDENMWVFSSYNGKYADSPKCVSEYVHDHYPNINIYWLIEQKNEKYVPKYVKCLNIRNEGDVKFALDNASVLIDNIMGPCCKFLFKNDKKARIMFSLDKYFQKRKNQTVYTFWHGFGVKRGMNERDNLKTVDISFGNLYFLLPTKKMIDHFKFMTNNEAKGYILAGSPRNDILLDDKLDYISIKKRLNLPVDKKIVLYAPTFRGDTKEWTFDVEMSGISQINMIDIDKLTKILSRKFGEDFILVVRLHHLVEEKMDLNSIIEKSGDKFYLGNVSPDMSDYLCVTDVLITDFSSSPSDFVLTQKPVFLFVPDYEDYKLKYGLSRELKTLPFPFAITSEELYDNILNFDIDDYRERVKYFFDDEGYLITNKATQSAVEFILNKKRRNK